MLPQDAVAWAQSVVFARGLDPLAIKEQLPTEPVMVQLLHALVQAAQHTPSVHTLVPLHWVESVHGWPAASLVPHLPLTQASPVAQSSIVVQLTRHEVGGLLH